MSSPGLHLEGPQVNAIELFFMSVLLRFLIVGLPFGVEIMDDFLCCCASSRACRFYPPYNPFASIGDGFCTVFMMVVDPDFRFAQHSTIARRWLAEACFMTAQPAVWWIWMEHCISCLAQVSDKFKFFMIFADLFRITILAWLLYAPRLPADPLARSECIRSFVCSLRALQAPCLGTTLGGTPPPEPHPQGPPPGPTPPPHPPPPPPPHPTPQTSPSQRYVQVDFYSQARWLFPSTNAIPQLGVQANRGELDFLVHFTQNSNCPRLSSGRDAIPNGWLFNVVHGYSVGYYFNSKFEGPTNKGARRAQAQSMQKAFTASVGQMESNSQQWPPLARITRSTQEHPRSISAAPWSTHEHPGAI